MISFIFDIDGTLLHAGGDGKRAFFKAFTDISGIEVDAEISFKGGLDFVVYNALLERYGLSFTHEKWEIFKKRYITELKEIYSRNKDKWIIFEKVPEIIEHLKSKNVAIGAVTGNIYEGAVFKLKTADIFQHFDFISACDLEQKRCEILRKGVTYLFDSRKVEDQKNIVYIGDSSSDREAASEVGVQFIGVLNGMGTVNDFGAIPKRYYNTIEELYYEIMNKKPEDMYEFSY